MKIYGFCRFSYFGLTDTGRDILTLEDAHRLLWNPLRMAVRFHLFENLLLPSLRAQTDQDFVFVIVTTEEMPYPYHARLDAAVADMPNIRILRTTERDINRVLRPVMLEANDDCSSASIHFRIDDDDAVCSTYIHELRESATRQRPWTVITFPTGIIGFMDSGQARHATYNKFAIAIGLAQVKDPNDLRCLYRIQHKSHAEKSPCFVDPTFCAYHYTRHSTNNTSGYAQTIHIANAASGTTSDRIRRKYPELAEGALITALAEEQFAQAFSYSSPEAFRDIIAATERPEELIA